MAAESKRLSELRDYLNDKLHKQLDELYINGSMEHRLPHNLNISFAYVEGESLLMGINDVAVSSGSACTSASLEPSYVLKALGAGDDLAHSSIRFGLGRWTTKEEVDYVADKLTHVVTRLREMSPLYELAKEGVDLSTMQWKTEGNVASLRPERGAGASDAAAALGWPAGGSPAKPGRRVRAGGDRA